jgi:hypothetical protein
MQHQQVDGDGQDLRRLIQQLARLWRNDWDNADYPGKILPELMSDLSKGRVKEREILEKIREMASPDEWSHLPETVREEYALVGEVSEVRSRLKQMIKHFQLAKADVFFQQHSRILDKDKYETMRRKQIEKRRHTIKQELQSHRFKEAEQFVEETCEVLLPVEAQEMKDWFQDEATRFANIYLQRRIVPLLEEYSFEEARREFQLIIRFVDADEYKVLEAKYTAEQYEDLSAESPQALALAVSRADPRTIQRREGVDRPENRELPTDRIGQRREDANDHVTGQEAVSGGTSWKSYYLLDGETLASRKIHTLRREAGRLGILHLIHFTQVTNVKSILVNGLFPRQKLENGDFSFTPNDERRLDNMRNTSSLSISFPNYKMFFKYRELDPSKHWVVLLLGSEILWQFRCFFFRNNAASSTMRSTVRFRKEDVEEFARLFAVLDGEPSREMTGIPDYYTTDPQAEVLVAERIPPSKIKAIVVYDLETLEFLGPMPPTVPCVVREEFFRPRSDYAHWRRRRNDGY